MCIEFTNKTGGCRVEGGGAAVKTLNVSEVIESSPLAGVQLRIAAICIVLAFVDGFDLVAITFAAPAIRSSLSLSPQEVGSVFSAALFGAMVGNFVCGPIGDRIRRKPGIVATTFPFA